MWLGQNTLCDQCPCVTPCPPGGTVEGEAVCFDGYVDTFNGGCSAASPVFLPIALDEIVCGESGVFFDGPISIPDEDWYELTLTETTEIVWTAQAEFRPRVWIFNGNTGCPATPLATASEFECNQVSVSALLTPGTYYLMISPAGFTDTSACPSAYTVTVTRNLDDLTLLVAPNSLSWTSRTTATGYDIVRGNLGPLRTTGGDFTVATEECLQDNHPTTTLSYATNPPAGEGFWFLVRWVETAANGSYDSAAPSQVGLRDAEIAASGAACP